MFWQELAVAVIVGLSVVWLVRHMRSILSVPQGTGGASCHGCDDCGEEAGEATRDPRPDPLVRHGAGTIH